MSHIELERMHDLIDGLVPPAEGAADTAHLESCPDCRAEYRRIEGVVNGLRTLPDSARTPADLWAGIERRIDRSGAASDGSGRSGGADVVSLPGAHAARRRISLSLPQLAAAAILIALLSSGTMWMATRGASVGDVPVASSQLGDDVGGAARMASSGEAAYEAALLELRQLVEKNRAVMAPETVESLDRSLATIDEALAEIRQALRQDPDSELLARLLANQQRSKLRVLRQAATAVQARS